jgi:hypothetical protein
VASDMAASKVEEVAIVFVYGTDREGGANDSE